MRYLNKVVFINSAHVRYAEIQLNGNVHLIGTQGVGKSTILRAILFFYNADKLKLGISKEKKSFDDFYFEKSNSYIIYEVVREESSFCVLVSKNGGRACYRFIDAPYSKNWIVDESGEVPSDVAAIRKNLEGVYISPIVDRYEQYRDILYGNKQAIRKEFYKFCLIESSRYQSMPRSIQNVFLNSKLDADFIKDTIIQSMESESLSIDLDYFRHQVSEFEQEYNDIGLWFSKNKKGECETRISADRVVAVYRALLQIRKNIQESCKELNFSFRNAQERLPKLLSEMEKVQTDLEKTKRLIGEEEGKYQKERDDLKADLTRIQDKLKACNEKRSKYESLNIGRILAKQEKEGEFEQELSREEENRRILLREYQNIDEKYERLIESVKRKQEEFIQIQRSKQNLREEKYNGDIQKLLEASEKNKSAVRSRFDEKLEDENAKILSMKEEKSELEKKLVALKFEHPFEKEISSRTEKLSELALLLSSKKAEMAELQGECIKLTFERDGEIAQQKSECEKAQAALENQKKELRKKIEELDELQKKQKGSFYEWLAENCPGWESNIGKVVDEEMILYNNELSPELDAGNSLFGVKIQLDALTTRVRTPEKLAEEKRNLLANFEALKKEAEKNFQNFEQQRAAIERKFGTKIKELREKIRELEADEVQIPILQKRLNNELEDWKRKERDEIENRRGLLNEKLNAVAQKILEAEELRQRTREDLKRELKKCEREYEENTAKLKKELETFKSEIAEQIEACKESTKTECEDIRRQKENELSANGGDVHALQKIESKIQALKKELDEIERNRKIVFQYENDKAELFDRESEFKETKRLLESKIESLKQKFKDRKEKLQGILQAQENSHRQLTDEKKSLESDVERTEKFLHSNICPNFIQDIGEAETAKRCSEIIDDLNVYLGDSQKRSKDLEVSINNFRSRFSKRNTFKFRTELNAEEDFLEFAENLNEFLLNQKIDEYRDRTSGRYVEILSRISKEVGNVTRQRSEIDKIINGVNHDFIEKNFAGVIKSIALRTEESDDKLMRLLLKMQEFYAANQYNMGDLSLFSEGTSEDVNRKIVELLLNFVKILNEDPGRTVLNLSDAFRLQLRVVENDMDSGWVDKISNVGSEGTDILVKAMLNILLINVFKTRVSRKFGEFKLHCMMDEIGRLHPKNANGILQFANARNIYLVNGSPTTQSVAEYRYTYLLDKNKKAETIVHPLMMRKMEA